MEFLLSWLKEFIELSVPPETLAERLTMGGLEVNRLERAGEDWLFEAEVTPNRPDLLSHLGIAREAAAVLKRPFRFPRWLSREMRPLREGKAVPFPVTVEDPEGCRRYIGIVIDGVQVRPSPPGMAGRLEKLGLRPVNNIVDVTNLFLLELGQPLHAFDLDKLEGKEVRVRRAKPGERLILLDGAEIQLTADQPVIADSKRPVALAGVMGGQATQITERTRRVLLESAWFLPSLIRRSARIAKRSTDSSYRFERGVDPEMVPLAALRAARWISQAAGGTVQPSSVADVGQAPPPARGIPLRPRKAPEILGMKISAVQQKRLLEHTGCRVRGSGRGWTVQPPSWRADLKIAEDLYEELARLFGYDRCAPTLPPLSRRPAGPAAALEDPSMEGEARLRGLLAAAGMQEIMTYSLFDVKDSGRVKPVVGAGVMELKNPLSLEQAVLRNTLLVGALQSVARNLNRKTDDAFRFFEIGSLFNEGLGRTPRETKVLGLLIGGSGETAWGVPRQSLGLFHLKGVLRLLCERWNIDLAEEISSVGGPFAEPGITLTLASRPVGRLGIVDPNVAAFYEIPQQLPLAYAELELELLLGENRSLHRVAPLGKIPPVQRDLAIVVPDPVSYADLHAAVRQEGRPLLEEALLFDLYQGKQVPAGKKSLAFRLIFSDADRTLTEAEIQAAHQKILGRLQQQFAAVLRS